MICRLQLSHVQPFMWPACISFCVPLPFKSETASAECQCLQAQLLQSTRCSCPQSCVGRCSAC